MLLIFILLSVEGCNAIEQSANGNTGPESKSDELTISLSTHIRPQALSDHFLGLSFELSDICKIVDLDVASDTYSQIFRNLPSGFIRFAGNAEDYTVWEPEGDTYCSDQHTVMTRDLVDEIFAFAHKIGWKVVWGLNFLDKNPTKYADEAAYVASIGGDTLEAFSIGNEPELYSLNGRKPRKWGYPEYIQEWTAYYEAIKARVPDAKIEAPDTTCCNNDWDKQFLWDTHFTYKDSIDVYSHHNYPTQKSASAQDERAATAENLLSLKLHNRVQSSINIWKQNVNTYGIPLVLSEVNSASGGGKAGISDTFVSTLWGIDYSFMAAASGVARLHFHGSHGPVYSPISVDTGQIQPLYYSMLFFSYATRHGGSIVPLTFKGSTNVAAYAIQNQQDGEVNIVLLNKELKEKVKFRLTDLKSYTKASQLRISAPTLDSKQVVFGAPIQENAQWHPGEEEALSLDQDQLTLELTPASATIVSLKTS